MEPNFFIFNFRKKSSRRIRLDKSTLPNLTVPMTCLVWLTSMMLVSCGTLLSGTRMSSSTPTPASSVLPSTHTRGSPSIPRGPWRSTLAREGVNVPPTSLVLLRAPTKVWTMEAKINLSSSPVSLVLAKLKTPRRLSPTLLALVPPARGRRVNLVLRTKLSRPTLFLKHGVMPRQWEMTTPPDLVNSFVSGSIKLVSFLVLIWSHICLRNLDWLSRLSWSVVIMLSTTSCLMLLLTAKQSACSLITSMTTGGSLKERSL